MMVGIQGECQSCPHCITARHLIDLYSWVLHTAWVHLLSTSTVTIVVVFWVQPENSASLLSQSFTFEQRHTMTAHAMRLNGPLEEVAQAGNTATGDSRDILQRADTRAIAIAHNSARRLLEVLQEQPPQEHHGSAWMSQSIASSSTHSHSEQHQ